MSAVLFEQKDAVAFITLNRPEAFNSITRELAMGLIQHLDDCEQNPSVRAIYLTGSGKAFCAGQDLKEVTNPQTNLGFRVFLEEHYAPIVRRLRAIHKPIIAAVNGVAAGAGANFALASDIIVAHEKASFIQAFSAIGLIPDSAGTYTLPRVVGMAKASAFAMLGDKISAQEAERIGMIYKVFSDEDFRTRSEELAIRLSQMPTKGLGLIKKALNQSLNNSFEEQLKLETELQIEASETHDYTEGVNAFLEKRKPNFIGS
jgi:2-(1,2-epoxy-1,2-dihydrophenyl)acetyl-CoA isomerase